MPRTRPTSTSGSRCSTRARSSASRRPHPQHRRGRRGAGVAVAHPDRDASGGHPHSADEAHAQGRDQPGAARHPDRQRAPAGAELGRPQGADRLRAIPASARCTRSSPGSASTTFKQGIEHLLDYAEAQARAVIRAASRTANISSPTTRTRTPSAASRAASRVTLTVQGRQLTFDFTGSDPQLDSSLNMPTGGDERHTLLMRGAGVCALLPRPDAVPQCGLACVRAAPSCPKGTMINPQFPAAVGMRTPDGCNGCRPSIFGAFAQALPDRDAGVARHGGPIMNVTRPTTAPGGALMASIGPIGGGAGGGADRGRRRGLRRQHGLPQEHAGRDQRGRGAAGILRYGLAQGLGRRRPLAAALGTEMEFEVSRRTAVVTARNRDRTVFARWGTRGGSRPGRPARSGSIRARTAPSTSGIPTS